MKIYTAAGPLPIRQFDFPDGQPHLRLDAIDEFKVATIEAAIRNPSELFKTLLAISALRGSGYQVKLDIRYLMGARMDRRISPSDASTLDVVANCLNSAGLMSVRILDPHSVVAQNVINNCKPVLPYQAVKTVLATLGDVEIVIPDKGAFDRVRELTRHLQLPKGYINCYKERDSATGKLSNFVVDSPAWQLSGRDCLIIDDICDGGGTFTGLAAKLQEKGARHIYLYVTHGIFSKKLPLDNILTIYTTDSYHDWSLVPHIPVVCIPISMKDLA